MTWVKHMNKYTINKMHRNSSKLETFIFRHFISADGNFPDVYHESKTSGQEEVGAGLTRAVQLVRRSRILWLAGTMTELLSPM